MQMCVLYTGVGLNKLIIVLNINESHRPCHCLQDRPVYCVPVSVRARYILVGLAGVECVFCSHSCQGCCSLIQGTAHRWRQSPQHLGVCKSFTIGSGQFTNAYRTPKRQRCKGKANHRAAQSHQTRWRSKSSPANPNPKLVAAYTKKKKKKKTKTIITHRNRNHTQALVNVAQNISSLLSIHHLWFSFPLFCCQWLGKTLMIIWTIFTGHQLDLWNESKYSLGVMLVQIWSRHGSYLVMIGGEKSCCVNYRWVKGSERERNRSWREWSAWNRSTAGKNKMPLTKKIGLCVCHGEEKKAKSGE